MTIRVPFPADVNPEPEAKYHRSMAQAFPGAPHLATAERGFPRPNRPSLWLIAAVLVLISLALSGCGSAEATEQSANPSELRRAAAAAWLCPGMHAEWLDETTARCLKERP